MKRILYVCTGNTCRSPIAQGLTNKYAKEQGLDISAVSAGIFPEENSAISQYAHMVLLEEGIDMSYHRARKITEGDIDNATVVICMSKQHAIAVVSIFPNCANKVYVMGENGISDPYGGNLEMYKFCKENIRKNIKWALKLAEDKHE